MADDYIRRVDALRGVELFQCGWAEIEAVQADYIGRLPAADVVEVVRCKECEHAERYERTDGTAGYYCGHPQNSFTYGERWDRVFKPAKEADDFCSYGKRRVNDG